MASSRQVVSDVRRRPRDRKQQILAQARDLFVELGYHNVTMSAIASGVGITAAALYRHFPNKAVLLEAVVDESFRDVGSANGAGTPAGSLAEVIAAAAEAATARPYLGALWAREVRHLPEDRQAAVREQLRRSAQGYARLIRAQRAELSAAEGELLAWGIQSVLASTSYGSTRVPAAEHARLVQSASRALVRTELVRKPEPRRRVSSRLTPLSTRERMLLAGIRQFAERGYQETSLTDIGSAAGVTGPNLYQYFDSKAALLLAVIERTTHGLWLDLDDALRSHANARDALAAVVAQYVDRLTGLPRPGWRERTGEPAVEALARTYQREYVAEWVALVRQSRNDVSLDTARVLVRIALTIIHDLSATPHLATVSSFAANVTAMALAVLYAT